MKFFSFFFIFLFLAAPAFAMRVGVSPVALSVFDSEFILINPEESPLALTLKSSEGIEVEEFVVLQPKEKRKISVHSTQSGVIEIYGENQISAGLTLFVEESEEENFGGELGFKGIWVFVGFNVLLALVGVIAWKKNIFSF